MKKILISDYDLTFFINEEGIKKNIAAVKEFRNQGNLFVIATGRSYDSIKKHAKKYGFSYDYCILNHGATIIDSHDNILYNNPIDNNLLMNLFDILDLENAKKYFCCHKLKEIHDTTNLTDITKVNVLYESFAKTKEINKKINNDNDFITYINRRKTLEVVSSSTNKFCAIKKLIQMKNLNSYQVYTIGDGYSDINMIKKYNGFAIKGAIEEVKEIATKEYSNVSNLIEDIISK